MSKTKPYRVLCGIRTEIIVHAKNPKEAEREALKELSKMNLDPIAIAKPMNNERINSV